MPFSYGTRSRQYVDVTQADPMDRIVVTLNDGRKVMLAPSGETRRRELAVDCRLTDDTVLEELYEHIHQQLSSNERYSWDGVLGPIYKLHWRMTRKIPSLDEVRQRATLEVSVNADRDSFDYSPRIGECLCVMALFPDESGSGWHSKQPITKVEFITLPSLKG